MAEPIKEQEATSSEGQPEESHRDYLARAVEVMQEAQDIVEVERGTILQRLWVTGAAITQTESEQEAAQLSQQMEFLLTMSGNYTLALRVLETIGGAALQGLAQTGIVVPPSPILDQDGEVISVVPNGKPRRKRNPKKE